MRISFRLIRNDSTLKTFMINCQECWALAQEADIVWIPDEDEDLHSLQSVCSYLHIVEVHPQVC